MTLELTIAFNPATRQLSIRPANGPAVAFVLDEHPPAPLASAMTNGAVVRHRFGCRQLGLDGVKCPRTFTTKRGRARHEHAGHGPRVVLKARNPA